MFICNLVLLTLEWEEKVQYNRKTLRMTNTEKKYITNEDNRIARVRIFLYMSDEGYFNFIIHHFVQFMILIIRIFNE